MLRPKSPSKLSGTFITYNNQKKLNILPKLFTIIIVTIAVIASSYSFSNSSSLQLEHLTMERGLPNNTIICQLQDSMGFIWFGTKNGLARYDGYEFKVYLTDSNETSSISHHYINALYEDKLGFIWIATDGGGLNRFDPKSEKFKTFYHSSANPSSLSHNSVTSLSSASNGKLWVGTSHGLNLFNPKNETFRHFLHQKNDSSSLSSNKIISLLSKDNGELWIGLNDGWLNSLSPDATEFKRYKISAPGFNDVGITDIAQSSNDNNKLFIGTRGFGFYIYSIDLNLWQHFPHDPENKYSLSNNSVNAILQDNHQRVWVATDNGLNLFDIHTENFIASYKKQDSSSLSDNKIQSILEDNSNMIWFGTWGAGVDILNPMSIAFHSITNGKNGPGELTDNFINALMVDPKGNLWVAGNKGLNVQKYKQNTFEHILHDPVDVGSLSDNFVRSFLMDNSSTLWVGTKNGGLNRRNEQTKKFVHYLHEPNNPKSLSHNAVQSIYQRNNGEVWVSTRHGLNKWDAVSESFQQYLHQSESEHSLSDNYLYTLYEDSKNRLWIATRNGGLNLWLDKSQSFISFTHNPNESSSISSNFISSIQEDNQGNLWVGTVGGGLNKAIINTHNNQLTINFKQFSIKDGIRSDLIAAIEVDKFGILWISTTDGISRFDPLDETFRNFGGVQGAQADGYFIGSSSQDAFGRIYFGGINGITRFSPRNVEMVSPQPQVVLTGIRLFNTPLNIEPQNTKAILKQSITFTPKITLNDKQSVFSIEFSALHFTNSLKNTYAYQLVGFDDAWIHTDAKRRFSSYTNLSAGTYTFKVKAKNSLGVWNEEGASLKITILPPWWFTWWAKIIAVTSITVILYLMYRLRIRYLTAQKQELKDKIRERTQNIITLSDIGKEISACLNIEMISEKVYQSVSKLMDPTCFGIGIYQASEGKIVFKLAMENQLRMDNYERDMSDKNQLAVWCIDNKKPLFSNNIGVEYRQYIEEFLEKNISNVKLSDGSSPKTVSSVLYVPLLINERVLGVITVQSYSSDAYNAHQMNMLQTLATYIAIALENANAYQEIENKNKEILTAQHQLVLAEKMASLGTLTAGVAHEINNPTNFTHASVFLMQDEITQIKALLTELAGGSSADPQVIHSFNEMFIKLSELIGTALEGTNRITKIVENLRTFTRLDTTEKGLADMGDLINATTNLVTTQFDTIDIKIEVSTSLKVSCFPSKLGQVFMNIIINSCQAIEEKSKKQQDSIPLYKGRLDIIIKELNEHIEIVFKDNGAGMEKTTLNKIFEPFFTTKPLGLGTGLGMAITYGIIEEHKGKIHVSSIKDTGTEISVTLPIT